ncbi:MAG TPA: DUF1015 domain-containing protein [Thermobifida alba]|nr:DUF1015 domain-containing protein [Thermobifida alba]
MSDSAADVLCLRPFRGLRYASPDSHPLLRVSDLNLALALTPPYDVVSADAVADLVRAEPRNAVRLTLPPTAAPRSGLSGPGRYARAAHTLRRWIADGVLVHDPDPALYVYEQTASDGSRQRGLIGALRLPPPRGRAVRGHEDVWEAPVADRARLMERTRANLEPIFLIYRGGTGPSRGSASRLTDSATGEAPLTDTVTSDGTRHRLWAITDPDRHAAIAADLSTRSALIADGHHRYAAYQRLRDSHPGRPAWAHGLALLVDSDAFPPRLGAIHRVFDGVSAHRMALAAAEQARVDDLTGLPVEESASRLARAGRRGPALLLADDRHGFLVHGVDHAALAAALPHRSARWRRLPTAFLCCLLLPSCGLRDEDARLVHDSAAEAVSLAHAHRGCAVVLPPPRIDDVYAVAAHGELTPRKSTSFGPKPRTGLVLRLLETDSTDHSDGRR